MKLSFNFFFNKLYIFFLNQCTKNRVLKQKKTFKIIFKIDENNKRKKILMFYVSMFLKRSNMKNIVIKNKK